MAKKKQVVANKARKVRAVKPGLRMDGAAAKYAALLADPCNGDLVPGPFGDGNGGMVCRFEKEYVINNSPTDTAAVFVFHPHTGQVAWQTTPLLNDTDPIALTVPSGSATHVGQAFLSANAGWMRCLAACVQVYYPGSELSRAGVVSLGRYPAELANDTTVSVSALRTQANYVMRTPNDVAEILWRPTEFDLTGREPLSAYSLNNISLNNTTSLVVTGAGLPVSTGLRIRVVAVYEWQPDPLSGFKNTIVRTPSPVRLADILARLDATGDWMSGAARSAGKAISSLAHGVASMYQLGNGAARLGRALLA